MTARPNIRITPGARRWIVDHGGAVTLRYSPRHGCCGGGANVPVAEARLPADAERHTHDEIDGVRVYCDPLINHTQELVTIDLVGFWRWQRLTVEGAALRADTPRSG